MNLNIAICDDEINDISILKKYISRYNVETDNNIVVSSFLSAKSGAAEEKAHIPSRVWIPESTNKSLSFPLSDKNTAPAA